MRVRNLDNLKPKKTTPLKKKHNPKNNVNDDDCFNCGKPSHIAYHSLFTKKIMKKKENIDEKHVATISEVNVIDIDSV